MSIVLVSIIIFHVVRCYCHLHACCSNCAGRYNWPGYEAVDVQEGLKGLGVSGVDALQRLKLRSRTTAQLEKMNGEENSELVGRVQELEQKLEMAEQAVNAKDQEIKESK